MAKSKRPYDGTKVSIPKSRMDVDEVLRKHGVTATQWTSIDDTSVLRFQFAHEGHSFMNRPMTVTATGRPTGKTQAMLEAAVVRADKLLAAGVRNPIVVFAVAGRVGELRKALDAIGAKTVQVQEFAGCTARPWRSCSRPDGRPLRHWDRSSWWTNEGEACS